MVPLSSTLRWAIPLLSLPLLSQAHVGAFAPGMYCKNGPDGKNLNSNTPVNPLFDLSFTDFWFQHDRGCDAAPPAKGEFLNLPAGGTFQVELANNQAFTTLSYDGENVSDWPDGGDHPEDWQGDSSGEGCIQGDGGFMHVQNESMAQGTAFAIARGNPTNLADIKLEDLVVITVAKHTPWHRLATYSVPADLPECPPEGCTCAWLWVPKGCGQPNVYMQPYRCQVTRPEGSGAGRPLAKAKVPVYCEGKPEECTKGAKQIIIWNQKDGVDNVVNVPPVFLASPGYNERNGFVAGAQDDIFDGEVVITTSSSTVAATTTTTSVAATTTTTPAIVTTTTTKTTTTTAPGGFYPVPGNSSTTTTTTPLISITKTPEDVNHVATSTSTSPSNPTPAPDTGDDDDEDDDDDDSEPTTPDIPSFPGFPGIPKPESSSVSPTETSATTFTSTFTGRYGRPTKFTCYIEEEE